MSALNVFRHRGESKEVALLVEARLTGHEIASLELSVIGVMIPSPLLHAALLARIARVGICLHEVGVLADVVAEVVHRGGGGSNVAQDVHHARARSGNCSGFKGSGLGHEHRAVRVFLVDRSCRIN